MYEFPKKLKVLTHDETNLHKTKPSGTDIYVVHHLRHEKQEFMFHYS